MTNEKGMGMNLLGKHIPDLRGGMCAYHHKGSYIFNNNFGVLFCMEASKTVADLGSGMHSSTSLCALFLNNVLRLLFGLKHQGHQVVSLFTRIMN